MCFHVVPVAPQRSLARMRLKASFSGDGDLVEELDVRKQKALEIMQLNAKNHPNGDLAAEMKRREDDAVRELEAEEAEEAAATMSKSGLDYASSLNARPVSVGNALNPDASNKPGSGHHHHHHTKRVSKQVQLQAAAEAAKVASAAKALSQVPHLSSLPLPLTRSPTHLAIVW